MILLVLGALAICALGRPGAAEAACNSIVRPSLGTFGSSLASTHFLAHYNTGGGAPITAADAQKLVDNAESAYSVEVGQWGYDPPLDDSAIGPDGRTDIFVMALSSSEAGVAMQDCDPGPASASIDVTPTSATSLNVIAHELFHVLQDAHYNYAASWIKESGAEWAATQVAGSSGFMYDYLKHPDVSLNCADGNCGAEAYGHFTFWEYLAERLDAQEGPGHGATLLKQVYQQSQPSISPPAVSGVEAALAAHGLSLGPVFEDFTRANLTGAYTLAQLKGRSPAARLERYTGADDAVFTDNVSVDHLAAVFIRYRAGDQAGTSPCGDATLRLSVTGPAGLPSQPAFYDGLMIYPISANGAPTDVPWYTCGPTNGLLALPNASTDTAVNAQPFAVKATLLPVLRNAPPVISLRLAKKLTISTRRRRLIITVKSDAAGSVAVTLHSRAFSRTFKLRAGRNKLKLTLPAKLKAGRHKITLTAISQTGRPGMSLHREVTIRFGR